ncbi:MAG: M64 family metallo-endopeptidase [Firmicutes bacterium]|nr:M64 family metallo-endopeptidase [Bacillota bacterium]
MRKNNHKLRVYVTAAAFVLLLLAFSLILIFLNNRSLIVQAEYHYDCGSCCFDENREEDRTVRGVSEVRALLERDDAVGFRRVHTPYGGCSVYAVEAEEMLNSFYELDRVSGSNPGIQPFSSDIFSPVPLVHSGRSGSESIVIVLLGDGYTTAELGTMPNPAPGTFLHSAREMAQTIVTMYPFSLFSNVFNIYAVPTASAVSGIRVSEDGPHAGTFFGTYLRAEWNVRMRGYARALEVAHAVSPYVVMTQIIANTTVPGGVAYWARASYYNVNTVGVSTRHQTHSMGTAWNRPAYHSIVIHEIGHNFGQLVDEHSTGFGNPNTEHANMALSSDTDEQLKWGHWLGHDNIQRRTTNAPSGYIFPSQNNSCKMQGWRPTFCAVCSAELVRRMALISGENFLSGRLPDGSVREAAPYVVIRPSHINSAQLNTRILPYAFHGNTSLRRVHISNSITTIGRFAFLGATNLRVIYNDRLAPQTINNTTFAGLDRSLITLRVPQGAAQAYQNAGWTGFVIEEMEQRTLIAPTNLAISDSILTWNASSYMGGYHIYSGGTRRTTDFVQGTSFDLTTLSTPLAAGLNNIQVRATSAISIVADSPLSEISSVTVLAMPINLSVNGMQVSWNAVTNATGYHVYTNGIRRTANPITATSVNFNSAAFLHGLSQGTNTVQIRAVRNAAGFAGSGLSASVNVNSPNLSSPVITGIRGWRVTWAPVPNATGYHVYSRGVRRTTTPITTRYFTFSNQPVTQIFVGYNAVQIRAITTASGVGNSELSAIRNIFGFQTLAIPANVQINQTTRVVTWNNVTNATGFFVYVNGIRGTHKITERTFDLNNIPQALRVGSNSIQIRAASSAPYRNDSDLSGAVNMTVSAILQVPVNVRLSAHDQFTISPGISWNAVANATGYHVYVNGQRRTTTPITATTFNIETLMPNLSIGSHSVQIRAISTASQTMNSPLSSSVNVFLRTTLNAFTAQINQVTLNLTWEEVANATNYTVEIWELNQNILVNSFPVGNVLSFNLNNIREYIESGTHRVSVVAFTTMSYHIPSRSNLITTAFAPLPPLSAPTGLSVDNETRLATWNAVSNATGYHVYVNGQRHNTNPIAATSLDLTVLRGGVFEIQVRAVSTAIGRGDSVLSGVVAAVFISTPAERLVAMIEERNEINAMISNLSSRTAIEPLQDAIEAILTRIENWNNDPDTNNLTGLNLTGVNANFLSFHQNRLNVMIAERNLLKMETEVDYINAMIKGLYVHTTIENLQNAIDAIEERIGDWDGVLELYGVNETLLYSEKQRLKGLIDGSLIAKMEAEVDYINAMIEGLYANVTIENLQNAIDAIEKRIEDWSGVFELYGVNETLLNSEKQRLQGLIDVVLISEMEAEVNYINAMIERLYQNTTITTLQNAISSIEERIEDWDGVFELIGMNEALLNSEKQRLQGLIDAAALAMEMEVFFINALIDALESITASSELQNAINIIKQRIENWQGDFDLLGINETTLESEELRIPYLITLETRAYQAVAQSAINNLILAIQGTNANSIQTALNNLNTALLNAEVDIAELEFAPYSNTEELRNSATARIAYLNDNGGGLLNCKSMILSTHSIILAILLLLTGVLITILSIKKRKKN